MMHEDNEKMLHLLGYLQGILDVFRPAFSREASFENFMVAVTGFLMADEVNVAKSGSVMACVKKMHQESGSMAKRPYIFGHFHGSMGAVIGSGPKAFFLPVDTTIQDGTNTVKSWKNPSHQEKSHVVQMMESAGRRLTAMGSSILSLDRFFLTLSAVGTLKDTN
jgi:hypothetical protein